MQIKRKRSKEIEEWWCELKNEPGEWWCELKNKT